MGLDVRGLRALAGITQIQAAKRSGVERSRLSLAECGHIGLSDEELDAVMRVLRKEIRNRAEKFRAALREEFLNSEHFAPNERLAGSEGKV